MALRTVKTYEVAFCFLIISIGYFLQLSSAAELIDGKLLRPALFKARSTLGRSPSISKNVKIFAFDDPAAAQLGKTSIPTDLWTQILSKIVEQEPKAIFIDQVFGYFDGSDDGLEQLQNIIEKFNTKLITGAFDKKFGSSNPLKHKNQRYKFRYSASINRGYNLKESRQVFGSHDAFKGIFRYQGLLDYSGMDRVKMVARSTENYLVPHATLLLDSSLRAVENFFTLNGKPLALGRGSTVILDFPSLLELHTRTYSFTNFLKRLDSQKSFNFINKEDIVILLPGAFTGNSDFKATSLGDVLGGYLQVTLANSVVKNQFLHEYQYPGTLYFAALILSITLILIRKPTYRLVTGHFVALVALLLGFASFIYGSFYCSFLVPVLAFYLSSVGTSLLDLIQQYLKNVQLQSALTGVVSRDVLAKIQKDPSKFSLQSKNISVSVMFVDIVGFSLAVEKMSAEESFAFIREKFNEFTKEIHAHGGVIDRSLGDGLLAFFGYDPYEGTGSSDHANAALSCANNIHLSFAKSAIALVDKGKPVVGVKIGINTGEARIGNVGGQGNIDLTIIGDAVNYAKRMEEACQPFRTMIGHDTAILLNGEFAINVLTPAKVQIKHHSEFMDVFEHDPFKSCPQEYQNALSACYAYAGKKRLENRQQVVSSKGYKVEVNGQIEGEILNISPGGMSIRLPQMFGVKSQITIKAIESNSKQNMVELFFAEVRWSNPSANGYVHGIRYIGLSEHRREEIMKELLSENLN